MKRAAAFLVALSMLVLPIHIPVYAEGIRVTINGTEQVFEQMPVMINDRVLVPMRAIFESLGATVDWMEAENKAVAVKDFRTVSIGIGKKYATVSGDSVRLDVPAQLIEDRTYVPVRFVGESLGAIVDWDDAAQTVVITSEITSQKSISFDTTSQFEAGKDFLAGGGYSEKNISLSSEQNYGAGPGKSVKAASREKAGYRLKLKNMFLPEEVGGLYSVSCWVYVPGTAASIRIGAYSDVSTAYATRPVASKQFEVPQATWTQLHLEFRHTTALITQLGIDQTGGALASDFYIDNVNITCVGGGTPLADTTKATDIPQAVQDALANATVVKTMNFESGTISRKEIASGASYDISGAVVSSDFDHTTGKGKSLKMGGRVKNNDRLKFADVFSPNNLGNDYVVSCWVYSPNISTTLTAGTYSVQGTDHAFVPVYSERFDVPKDKWVQIAFVCNHNDPSITMFGLEQTMESVLVPELYIDDITVGLVN